MPGVRHAILHFRQYGFSHKILYSFSLLIFFWALFDALISYVTPLVMTQSGLTETAMGLIYSSSSVFGAVFDLALSKILENSNFRRTFLFMFAICFVQPLLLWQAKGIPLFIIAMATWGLYYDFSNFGTFDFVGRQVKEDEHVSSFGIIEVFRALGYLTAPILGGILVVNLVDIKAFGVAWVFLVFSFVFYLIMLVLLKKQKKDYMPEVKLRPINFLRRMAIWKKIGTRIFPVLALTGMFFIYDAFFWTIGPIYIEGLKDGGFLSGSILTAYTLPALVLGFFVGSIVEKFGKKKSLYIPAIFGFLILVAIPFTQSLLLISLIIFISSLLTTISLTTIRGIYSDLIHEVPKEETDIEALGDFSTNIGYVLGPMTAGFLADKVGNGQSFAVLGVVGFVIVCILYKFSGRFRLT